MANWISSKLKVAETLLQQIDQQAAESLGKNEKPRSDDQIFDAPTKTGGAVSLKDQLKKKAPENNDYRGKVQSDPIFNTLNNGNDNSKVLNNRVQEKESAAIPTPSPKPKSTLTDSDWTELLSTSTQVKSASGSRNSNGVSANRTLKKDGIRLGSLGPNLAGSEGKRNQKRSINVAKSARRPDTALENKLNGKPSDGEESSSSGRSSSVEMQNDGKSFHKQEEEHKNPSENLLEKSKYKGEEEYDKKIPSKVPSLESLTWSANMSLPAGKVSELGKDNRELHVKTDVNSLGQLRSAVRRKQESKASSHSSISDDLKKGSLISDEECDSDSDSGSSSDSEREREREERRRRREKILAEKVAAKAVETIKEQENMVARLEGEKQSLEKILEEQAKQQAQEASKLQTTTMETMEAVELEKQKHNNTRMEVLARLAKLETANADLARSLAAAQKKLEVEINQIAELREQIGLKELVHGELKRRISETHQTGTFLNQLAAAKGVPFEREILEAEYAFVTDKIGRLQDKAEKLEASLEMMRKEMEDPTEVEVELKRRLSQLTDHLIQKQAQVEALSSEKATLLFRIEAVSRFLDENKSVLMTDASLKDLESGEWDLAQSKLRPMFEDKIRSGRKHFGSLVQQLDAIFLAGAVFLRRNPTAKLWSLVYLVCLHLWVIYILCSHSHTSNETKSGAVISLQNINNTSGV